MIYSYMNDKYVNHAENELITLRTLNQYADENYDENYLLYYDEENYLIYNEHYEYSDTCIDYVSYRLAEVQSKKQHLSSRLWNLLNHIEFVNNITMFV